MSDVLQAKSRALSRIGNRLSVSDQIAVEQRITRQFAPRVPIAPPILCSHCFAAQVEKKGNCLQCANLFALQAAEQTRLKKAALRTHFIAGLLCGLLIFGAWYYLPDWRNADTTGATSAEVSR